LIFSPQAWPYLLIFIASSLIFSGPKGSPLHTRHEFFPDSRYISSLVSISLWRSLPRPRIFSSVSSLDVSGLEAVGPFLPRPDIVIMRGAFRLLAFSAFPSSLLFQRLLAASECTKMISGPFFPTAPTPPTLNFVRLCGLS